MYEGTVPCDSTVLIPEPKTAPGIYGVRREFFRSFENHGRARHDQH